MTDDFKLYVDPDRPATLNDGMGALTDYATLVEAVLAWRALAPERKIRAAIKVIGGPVYTIKEIDRLHYGPNPGVGQVAQPQISQRFQPKPSSK